MLELINNQAFGHFCRNPHTALHIRELARTLAISAPKCIGLIKELEKLGLVKRKAVGRSIVISANLTENFIFYKKWANLFFLIDSGLIRKISGEMPETLILFGSYARGEDNERSDIDIATDADITEDLSKYEKMLSRKIQMHKINKNTPKNLLENIRQGILLHGVMI